MRHLLCLLCVFLAAFSHTLFAENTAPSAQIIQLDQGRDYGILVGDVIHHHYLIKVNSNYSLSLSSLPVKGELNYWLDLNNVKFASKQQGDKTLYRLTLSYQTFYAPLDVRRLIIPSQELVFSNDNNERVSLALPDWSFTMSPIKEITPSGVGNEDATAGFMKADISPFLLDTAHYKTPMLIYAVLASVSILLLTYFSGWLPLSNASPFTKAKRQLKPYLRRRELSQDDIEAALQACHDAFNQRAKHTVFASQINAFLIEHPQFCSHKQAIEAFFEQSRQVFFFAQKADSQRVKDCYQLCKQLSAADKVSLTS